MALYNSCKHSICEAKLLYNKRHGVSHFDRVSKWIATSTILLFFYHLNAFLDPTIFSLHLTAFMLTISNWTRNCSFLSKAFIELLLKHKASIELEYLWEPWQLRLADTWDVNEICAFCLHYFWTILYSLKKTQRAMHNPQKSSGVHFTCFLSAVM